MFTGVPWSSFLLDSIRCAKSNALTQQDQVLGCLKNFNSASFHIWFFWLCDYLPLYLLHRSITFYQSCLLCGLLLVWNECQPAKSVFTDFFTSISEYLWSGRKTLLSVWKQVSEIHRTNVLRTLQKCLNSFLQGRVILMYVLRVWFFGFYLCTEWYCMQWKVTWGTSVLSKFLKNTAYMLLFPYGNKSDPEKHMAVNQ